MKRMWLKRAKLNHKGSALLTVILVVAFLTILATTLLYITGMNFIIKQADYQNKKNFYNGETALEEMKAALMEKVVSDAAIAAYEKVGREFVTASNGDVRQIEYKELFVEEVEKILYTETTGKTWETYLSTLYSDPDSRITLKVQNPTVLRNDTDKKLSKPAAGVAATYNDDPSKGVAVITGIKITYINEHSLATIISTDLELHAPEIDWENAEETAMDLSGVSGTDDAAKKAAARVKKKVDVSKSVIYTNWTKE